MKCKDTKANEDTEQTLEFGQGEIINHSNEKLFQSRSLEKSNQDRASGQETTALLVNIKGIWR